MTTYEVTVEVEPGLVAAFTRYMLEQHIPEILATGCFRSIRFERAEEGRFRTRYEAEDPEDLERYLREHTARFRADFMARFPAGCTASRETWEAVRAFGDAAG
jgi:hypothetical protein